MKAEEFDRAHLWRFRARTVRVIDADTVLALVDCGYRGRHEARLRIHGIDAPEVGTKEGNLARAWLATQIDGAHHILQEWPLRVETIQRETIVSEVATFERWVSKIWLVDDDGEMFDLADALVAAGHGVYREGSGV